MLPEKLAGLFIETHHHAVIALVPGIARRFQIVAAERLQALPIHRLIFHPSLGSPRLAQRPAARRLVSGIERLAEAVVPSWAWAYLHLRAVRVD